MKLYSKYYFGFILVGISLLYQSCIDLENPYEDTSKARIVITYDSRLQDGDSVFADKVSNYKLKLAFFLKEYIDLFTVRVGSVTTVLDTSVVVTENIDNPFSLNLQFSDSGQTPITIITYYKDDTKKEKSIFIYGIIPVSDPVFPPGGPGEVLANGIHHPVYTNNK